MNELIETLAPKSDQLNATDLIAGPKRIRITKVVLNDDPKQKASIYFDGDNGKPYKPCLSMRRLLVLIYGKGTSLTGKEIVLFRDAEVVFGGEKVGGIVISHASHITAPQRHVLPVSKGKIKVFTVEPLAVETYAAELKTLTDCTTLDQLKAAFSALSPSAQKALGPDKDRLKLTLT